MSEVAHTGGHLIVREIRPSDAESVAELSEQLGYTMSFEKTVERIVEIMSSKDLIAFGALQDRKVIGWIHARHSVFLVDDPFIEIGGLIVGADYRGLGIGKRLVQKIKDWCLKKNIPVLRVRSSVKRSEAHQFYLSQGFRELKQQKVFVIDLSQPTFGNKQ